MCKNANLRVQKFYSSTNCKIPHLDILSICKLQLDMFYIKGKTREPSSNWVPPM